MNIYYDSYDRFSSRIKRGWRDRGFMFNGGHENIIRYAWWTRLYWGNIRGERVSSVNKVETNLRLF